MIKGKRYIGTCTSKSGLKNTVHRVEWTDQAGIRNVALFSITSLRKPPYSIKVYSIDGEPDKANLGIRSIMYYIPVVILFDMTLLLLVFGTIPEFIRGL
ncbi:MAG: hypothetical protein IJ779_08225 [Ruminococcus sp.]|nr:hypothetical protein [Ruminococcus sp.]